MKILGTKINGFQLGHLFVFNFYRLFWFAIRYYITGETSLMKRNLNFISVGGAYPVDELWDAGFRVRHGGYVFGRPIILYEPPPTIMNVFSLPLPVKRWMEYGKGVITI